MSIPPALRGAYERGRLRDAALSALPVLLLPIGGILLAGGELGAVALGLGLVAAFVVARWRGQSWSQGAVVGVLAGGVAAAAPICLALGGAGCLGSGCGAWCAQICSAAGVLAGIIVGRRTRDWRALGTAAAVAVAAGALGCWPMGIAMVTSAAGALLLGALGGRMGRWVMSR